MINLISKYSSNLLQFLFLFFDVFYKRPSSSFPLIDVSIIDSSVNRYTNNRDPNCTAIIVPVLKTAWNFKQSIIRNSVIDNANGRYIILKVLFIIILFSILEMIFECIIKAFNEYGFVCLLH